MKILGKNESLCVQCHACEEVCSKLYFKEEDRTKSAVRIAADESGEAKISVCTQCGVCADICPVQAITRIAGGAWLIDKTICVGCFACVGFCPEAAMFHHDDLVEPFKCVACGVCAKSCPVEAVFLAEQPNGGKP